MSSYNDFIKDFFPKYFQSLCDMVSNNNYGYYVVNGDIELELTETGDNITEILERHETSEFIFKYKYISCLDEEDEDYQAFESEFRIPRMVNGVFILDGKYRLPNANLRSCNEMRNIGNFILIDYFRRYNKLTGCLEVKKNFLDEDEYPDGLVIKANAENMESFKWCFKLTDYQMKKTRIKYDYDTEYLDDGLILAIIAAGDDLKADKMIDKVINTVEKSFKSHMWKAWGEIASRAKYSYVGSGNARAGRIPTGTAQKLIRDYFSMKGLTMTTDIQAPSTINPINFQALASKIKIPTSVTYNKSFVDFIDIVDTPINNNVNVMNELTVSTRIIDGVPHLRIFDKDFNRVVLSYLDFLDNKILMNDQVNWDNKTVIPKDHFMVKYREKIILSDTYDYIDCPADEKLSVTTRRIPMINVSDPVRNSMGTSMFKQAVELNNGEAPLVQTGTELDDAWGNPLSVLSSVSGNIVSVDSTKVVVSNDETGKDEIYFVPRGMSSVNDVSTNFTPVVKEGSRIEKGSVIITPKVLSKGTFDMGLNAYTAFMPFWGLNSDDSLAVSQEFAERAGHYSIMNVEYTFYDRDTIQFITQVGDSVSSSDIIVKSNRELKMGNRTGTLAKSVFAQSQDILSFENNDKKAPNNIFKCYISDILIIKGDNDINDPATKLVIENTKNVRNQKALDDANIPDYLSNQRCEETPTDREDKAVFSYRIKMKLVQLNPLVKGSKLTNRWGSKGTIAKVVPTKEMPYDSKGRRIEIVLSAESPIARLNMSQDYEMSMTKIARHLYGRFLEVGNSAAFTELFNKVYDKELTIEELSAKIEKEKLFAFKFVVGSYSNVSPDWMQSKFDLVGTPKYERLVEGKYNRPIDDAVNVGEMYFLKLYHFPEYSGKATSSLPLPKTGTPRMGNGLFRGEGQKLGEQETTAMTINAPEVLQMLKKTSHVESSRNFYNHMLLVGIGILKEDGSILGTGTTQEEELEQIKKLQNKFNR